MEPANGIILDTGRRAVTINEAGLASATARGVKINAGSGNVTYAGSHHDSGAAARSVEVTSHTGGDGAV